MRMPTDPLQVDSKDEKQSELCEDVAATLEAIFPGRDSQLHIQMGRFVCWDERYTMFKMQQASLERKIEAVPPQSII